MLMYRASPASTAQGKKQHNNTHKIRHPNAQQTSRQQYQSRTTHHIIHAFERKTKHPQVFLSAAPTPILMEKTSHRDMEKRVPHLLAQNTKLERVATPSHASAAKGGSSHS